jgi:hypothetical protein
LHKLTDIIESSTSTLRRSFQSFLTLSKSQDFFRAFGKLFVQAVTYAAFYLFIYFFIHQQAIAQMITLKINLHK